MVLPDDPKEPHFSSMLPWMLLYHLLKPDEAELDCTLRQHQADDDEDGIFHKSHCLGKCHHNYKHLHPLHSYI